MENQKIINLLDKIDTDSKNFATKKWYIINDENNTNYGVNKETGADNPDTNKYDTRVLKPNVCDYAEAYILIDGTNFFRSLEMPLINCKIKLNLTWKKECVSSNRAGAAVFIISDTKMYVPVVTLPKEDNKDFIEQQIKGFQRSIYWNEYKTKEINENADANVFKYINLDPSFQCVNRLFVMAYNREDDQPTRNGQQKYYLPRIDLKKHNVIIDGRNVYDNPIENDIEKYRELKKSNDWKRRRLYYRIFVRF